MIVIIFGFFLLLYFLIMMFNLGFCVCVKSDNFGVIVLKNVFVRNGGIFFLFVGKGLLVCGGDVFLGCWLVDEEVIYELVEGGVFIGVVGKDVVCF